MKKKEVKKASLVLDSNVFSTPQGTLYLKSPGIAMISKPDVNNLGIGNFLEGFPKDYEFIKYLKDPVKLPPAEKLAQEKIKAILP